MSTRPSWAQYLPLPSDDVRALSERAIQPAMAVWASDIPPLDPETRAMSERAVHQQWTSQLQREAEERNHWRQVLAPREDISADRYASAFHGPYRRRRLRRAGHILRAAAVWLAFIASGLIVGAGFSTLAGCSPASDSRIDELIALDLADAVAQAQQQERSTTTAYQFRGAAQMAAAAAPLSQPAHKEIAP